MNETTKKSFYIFLSTQLGILLFLTVQRVAFIIAFLMGFDISSFRAQALDMVTLMIAVTFGAWYGIWVGLVWYRAIYEEHTSRGLFGWLRDQKAGGKSGKSWELSKLVALEGVSASGDPQLEYFESNTVKFDGNTVGESVTHHITPARSRAVARRPRKVAAKKIAE